MKGQILGIIFLATTIIAWVGSSLLLQYIFEDSQAYNKPFLATVLAESMKIIFFLFTLVRKKIPSSTISMEKDLQTITTKNLIFLSIGIGIAMFLGNYLFNISLGMTKVSSSTIISNLSIVFIFLFSLCFLQAKFYYYKLILSIISLAGSIVVALSQEKKGTEGIKGDIIALISTLIYSIYAISLAFHTSKYKQFDWFRFFGYIGLVNLLLVSPFLYVVDILNIEKFVIPSFTTILYLLFNALLGGALPDFTWARSNVLLSPLTNDLGIGLSIPLSMIGDYICFGTTFSLYFFLGATAVLFSFVLITYLDHKNREKDDNQKSKILIELN